MTKSAIDVLTDEYHNWMTANGYTHPDETGDAYEMMFHPRITPEQVAWLEDFRERWNAKDRADPEFYDKQTVAYMGTRVLYQILKEQDGKPYAAMTLYSNNSHPEVNPEEIFEGAVRPLCSLEDLAIHLLSRTYRTNGGIHHINNRMFHFVDDPFGDYERVWLVDHKQHGLATWFISKPSCTAHP